MNKQELIARNQGVKLYDLSDSKEMQLMKQNLYDRAKVGREPTFKLIAPFGHSLKYKSDFYYFESENTPISEQILEEMGFENIHSRVFLKKISGIIIKIIFEADAKIITINNQEKNINANQLFTLIELLK